MSAALVPLGQDPRQTCREGGRFPSFEAQACVAGRMAVMETGDTALGELLTRMSCFFNVICDKG